VIQMQVGAQDGSDLGRCASHFVQSKGELAPDEPIALPGELANRRFREMADPRVDQETLAGRPEQEAAHGQASRARFWVFETLMPLRVRAFAEVSLGREEPPVAQRADLDAPDPQPSLPRSALSARRAERRDLSTAPDGLPTGTLLTSRPHAHSVGDAVTPSVVPSSGGRG
jgi:hypothetical protein